MKQEKNSTTILFITAGLVALALFEVSFGWLQLMGFERSSNLLYPVTGTFTNPGPYACFIAVLTPIALFNVIKFKKGFLHWESLLYLIVATSLLPFLESRTAWIACISGCLVTGISAGWIKKPRKIWVAIGLLIIVIAGIGLYLLKPGSALGRLLIWICSIKALWIKPLQGVGWYNVPGAIGEMQEIYFANHQNSLFEMVAGVPEYAFNEFLQIGIAFGLPIMIIFILLTIYSYRNARKGNQFGICGAIISFCIACMASYPLQFAEFIFLTCTLFFGGIISNVNGNSIMRLCIPVSLMFICLIAVYFIQSDRKTREDWNLKRFALINRLTDKNILLLDSLANVQKNNVEFIFDYGKALRNSGYFDKSTCVLIKGLRVSSDPMFLNLIGENYSDTGDYETAEIYFQRSVNRLPSRMYPYYLLARLYADSSYYDPEKFRKYYDKAMKMKPKVNSPAIREMREVLQNLL